MANIQTFYKSKNGNDKLSANFSVREFACNDGSDKILIDKEMIFILQKIRELGGAVTINSAYRTPTYNSRVGGATNSYHCKGQAFDIVSSGLSIDNVCRVAKKLGVKGIIKYNSFTHIDSRNSKYHASSSGSILNYSNYSIPFTQTLKQGSKNNDVGVLQFKLNSLGYSCGIVDGDFGGKTYNSVIQYQKNNCLAADGIVGQKTWSKLFN